jgi:hypothetical protein
MGFRFEEQGAPRAQSSSSSSGGDGGCSVTGNDDRREEPVPVRKAGFVSKQRGSSATNKGSSIGSQRLESYVIQQRREIEILEAGHIRRKILERRDFKPPHLLIAGSVQDFSESHAPWGTFDPKELLRTGAKAYH